jgi:hypothetical protein
VDSDAPDSLADHLDFAGVNAGLDLDSERLHAPDCGGRTPDGAAGTVEHGEETVAGRVNLAAAETGQLATHEGVMALEKLPPRSITDSSMDGSSDAGTGSDRPVPRLSKVSTRPNLASRRTNAASGGTSHWLSMLLNHWVSSTMSTGPSPTSWYATCRPLFLAYRVSGSVTVTRSQPKTRDASAAEGH